MLSVLPFMGLFVFGHSDGISTSCVCLVSFEIVEFLIVFSMIFNEQLFLHPHKNNR